jgi:hypothetical protein
LLDAVAAGSVRPGLHSWAAALLLRWLQLLLLLLTLPLRALQTGWVVINEQLPVMNSTD